MIAERFLIHVLDKARIFSNNTILFKYVKRKHDVPDIMISENGSACPEKLSPAALKDFIVDCIGGKPGEQGLVFLPKEMMMQRVTMEIRSYEGEGTRIILNIPFKEAL